MSNKCSRCGAYMSGHYDYCSTCRLEAASEGRQIDYVGGDVGLAFAAIAIVLFVLQWIFETIWDYKWWILGIAAAVYFFINYKNKN